MADGMEREISQEGARSAREQAAFEYGAAALRSGHHMVVLDEWTPAEKLAAMRGFRCYPDQIAAEKRRAAIAAAEGA